MMHHGTASEWSGGSSLAGRSRASVSVDSDDALLGRFLTDRDDEAFATLLGRHGPSVLTVCRRILGTGQDADDAFQATFLVLLQREGTVCEPGNLGAWLRGVARRVALRAKSQAAGRLRREGVDVSRLEIADEADIPDRELAPLLRAEVQRLPEQYRRPLELCWWQGLSNEEAAARLACPTGTIKWRLARGREMLRGRLSRLGFASLLLLLLGRSRPALAAEGHVGNGLIGALPAGSSVGVLPDSLAAATLEIAVFARDNAMLGPEGETTPTSGWRVLPRKSPWRLHWWGILGFAGAVLVASLSFSTVANALASVFQPAVRVASAPQSCHAADQ